MFFILLFEPLFLFQVGFQMSYAAVFAIVWLYPKLQDFWRPKNVLLRKTWQLFSVGGFDTLSVYTDGFMLIAKYSLGAGIIVLLASPLIKRLMGNVH